VKGGSIKLNAGLFTYLYQHTKSSYNWA